MRYGGLGCGAVRCGAVRCGAVRCGAVRCGAVRCVVSRLGALLAQHVLPMADFKLRERLRLSFSMESAALPTALSSTTTQQ